MDNFKQVAEVYRKIRNTIRFMLGNTSDFDPKTDAVPYENLREVDQYHARATEQFIEESTRMLTEL